MLDTTDAQLGNGGTIAKRPATSANLLPAIKPEPIALSPSLLEPSTSPSKSITDSTSPNSTTIVIEPNTSPSQQQQPTQSHTQSQANSSDNGSDSFPLQCIRFAPFQQQNWHVLCDQSLQEL